MNPQELVVGQIIDLKITRNEEVTYIVGKVVGIRADYFNPDTVAVLISGIDWWMVLGDDVEWEVIND